jgi:GNAT superfamily N-acetyltransferase
MTIVMRRYATSDQRDCLALFDANCPGYFDPGERVDYVEFLDERPAGYEVCLQGRSIVGASGVCARTEGGLRLRWILISPASQGQGVGKAMMTRALEVCRASGEAALHIAASQKSAPFFARFGARAVETIPQGWGPTLDRVEMVLENMQH